MAKGTRSVLLCLLSPAKRILGITLCIDSHFPSHCQGGKVVHQKGLVIFHGLKLALLFSAEQSWTGLQEVSGRLGSSFVN